MNDAVRASARLLTLSAALLEAAHAGEKMDTPANSLRLIEARAILVQLGATGEAA